MISWPSLKARFRLIHSIKKIKYSCRWTDGQADSQGIRKQRPVRVESWKHWIQLAGWLSSIPETKFPSGDESSDHFCKVTHRSFLNHEWTRQRGLWRRHATSALVHQSTSDHVKVWTQTSMKRVNHFCAAVIALLSSPLLFSSAPSGIFYFKSFVSFREVCLMWMHDIITYHTLMHMKEVKKKWYVFVGFLFSTMLTAWIE